MNYKVFADSPALYTFLDEQSREKFLAALIYHGKKTEAVFEHVLRVTPQIEIQGNQYIEEGKPIECFTVGGCYIISQNIKTVFDKYNVHGEYFEVSVELNGAVFEDSYFLFNPFYAVDCIDLGKSSYKKEYDDWSKIFNISDFSKLIINEKKIPSDIALFFLESSTEKNSRILSYVILISDLLAKELFSANLRGLNIFELEEYRYDWKWKKNDGV